jgi:hypothetical protein
MVVGAIGQSAPASATNTWDASAAIRYDSDGTVIGSVVQALIDEDDDYWIDTAPAFPTNFFGLAADEMCVTTNGSIYPTTGGNCTDEYDYGMGELAVAGDAPMIAALATDSDSGEDSLMIENEDGVLPSGPVTGTSGASGGAGTLTVTTSASVSDLAVGDKVYLWGTGNATLDDESFTITALDSAAKTISFSVGAAVPDGLAQGRWYYYRLVTYGGYTGTSTSGSTATLAGVTVEDGAGLLVGDFIAFASSDASLDARNYVVSAVTSNSISFTLPAGAPTPTNTGGSWFVSDGVGAIRTVNYGTATVDGRQAMVMTWYRLPQNDADNADFLYNTLQIVIVKRATGDSTVGFDFDIEFNYGTLLDDEDGYDATDPTSDCTAYTDPGIVDGLADCRWGVGTASFVPNVQVQSIAFSGTEATITTASPHGLAGLGSEVWIELDASGNAVLDSLNSNDRARARVTGPSTLTFPVEFPGSDTTFTPTLPYIDVSDVYELYADYSIDRLADSGDTAMVDNSVNSSVLGRYTFAFVGGTPSGFKTLADAISGPAPASGGGAPAEPEPTPTPTPTPTPSPTRPSLDAIANQQNGNVPPAGLAAGSSLHLVNGVPTGLVVEPNDPKVPTGLNVRGDGFFMKLAGLNSQGRPLGLSSDGGALILEADRMAQVEGNGFLPNSEVRLFVFSTPRYIGSVTTDATGSFLGKVPIPSDIPAGRHTLQANGYTTDAKVRSLSLGVVVREDRAPRARRAQSTVTFDAYSAQLSATAKRQLKALLQGRMKTAVRTIAVGYVQPSDITSNDQRLSQARADAVRAYLRSLGLKGPLTARGDGIATESGAAGRKVVVSIRYTK